jgi:hypothetical protein
MADSASRQDARRHAAKSTVAGGGITAAHRDVCRGAPPPDGMQNPIGGPERLPQKLDDPEHLHPNGNHRQKQ